VLQPPVSARRTILRTAIVGVLLVLWLLTLLWLAGEAAFACVYPDPIPGGCPVEEVRAAERFERWTGPVLVAGPIAMLAAWAATAPSGARYKPLWYLAAVAGFCAAPTLGVDAALSGSEVIDHPETYSAADQAAARLKLAAAGVTGLAAIVGLAVLAYRRGAKEPTEKPRRLR
jgi:hypothetical protein